MLYYLRDRRDELSIKLLGDFLKKEHSDKINPLFKHEVCFVLGQVGEDAQQVIPQLIENIKDVNEDQIVRHEAINAYSGVTDKPEFLEPYLKDPNQIVSETVEVALGMIDYWKN